MKIKVITHPNSRHPRIEKDLLGDLNVYVHEPPLEGKANSAVAHALAKHFNVPNSFIILVKGEKSKIKIFEILDK
jgi:uncharacterized protein YggU (UPF0235/DUF167 family)